MAQVQAQQQEYAKAMAQRKGQNDAQVYQLLTQNMPSPVGYQQGPTSQEAQTTMIGAGTGQQLPQGVQGGILGGQQQMSPAQIAAMRGQFMAQAQNEQDMQGMPPGMYPQGIYQGGMPPQGPPPQGIIPQQLTPQQIAAMQAQQAPQTQQAPVAVKRGGYIMNR
jgi:hypothetical protein